VKTTQVRNPDGTRLEHRYWENGIRRWEFRYDAKGKQHGTCQRWHPNGRLFVEERWDHGKKTGAWVYYSEDGRQSARFTWEDDREVAHEVWSAPEKRWVPFDAR
jgi:antitoxin component YwqK of YwqJK toxin-antitoxin module